MANNKTHIIEYKSLSITLLVLLFLTFLTISITGIHLGSLTLGVALLIACTKSFIVLSNFMHLRYENLLLRILVSMVFVLFALIVLLTFIDYAFR
jgi:cytochrome c oxidase subunit IV